MFDHRQRLGYLVLAVILGHVILISAQVNTGPGTTALESLTFGSLAEAQRVVSTAYERVTGVWTQYVELRDLRAENETLQQNLDNLRLEMQQQRALARRAEHLARLLDLRESMDLPTVSARVIAADATPYFRTLTIDRGTRDGVRTDLAVLAPKGVVGRVVGTPGTRAARVQLLIDRNAAAGALIERTRATGVVVGGDDDSRLRMEYVSNLEDVRVGDRVVTSGIDGIYPKGFLIGAVQDVEPGPGLYLLIQVDPVVEFSKVEDVLVVLAEPTPEPPAEGSE